MSKHWTRGNKQIRMLVALAAVTLEKVLLPDNADREAIWPSGAVENLLPSRRKMFTGCQPEDFQQSRLFKAISLRDSCDCLARLNAIRVSMNRINFLSNTRLLDVNCCSVRSNDNKEGMLKHYKWILLGRCNLFLIFLIVSLILIFYALMVYSSVSFVLEC